MKHVKILSIATALFLSGTQCMAATVNTPVVDTVNDMVTLSGKIDEAGENIVITVLNPGAKIEEFVPNEDNNSIDDRGLQHQRVITSDVDGSFKYTFQINTSGENVIGSYKVYIDSINQDLPLDTEFFFASKEMQEKRVEELLEPKKENEGELPEKAVERILSDNDTAEVFGLNSFETFEKQEKAEIAKILYNATKDMTNEEKKSFTPAEMKKLILECSVLAAYNTGNAGLVISADGEFLHEDIIGFENLDTKLDMTLVDVYKNTVSENGQKLIRDALVNRNYESIEDLQKEFAKEIVLKGLTNADKKGFAHVQKILTDKNAKAVGLTLSKSITDAYAIEISKVKEYTSIDELQKKINSLKNTGTGSGGSSNSGSSGNRGNSTVDFSIGNVPAGNINDFKPGTENKKFVDMTNYQWAESAVYSLFEKGIINGVDDTHFAPQNLLTREQAVKLICEAMGITEAEGKGGFLDIAENAWYRGFVAAAKKAEIVSGISDTEFGVGRNVTRQDFAVMICRAFNLNSETATLDFADGGDVAEYAKKAVATLSEKGIITGYGDNTFRPNGNCRRAEAAVIIYRVLENTGR